MPLSQQNKRGRVAMLHYTCPPVVGGVESVMASHARLFAAAGYEVGVFAGRGPAPQDEPPGIHTTIEPLIDSKSERLAALNQTLDEGGVPEDFEPFVQEIKVRLKSLLQGYDALIVHNALTLHKNLALTAALVSLSEEMTGTRFISWCHDLAWTNELYAPVLHPSYPWDLLRTTAPNIKYVAISPQRQSEILATFRPALTPANVPVVPNGVSLADFLKLSDETRAVLAASGLDKALREGALMLLLPARITRRKNIELAVRVAAELKKSNPVSSPASADKAKPETSSSIEISYTAEGFFNDSPVRLVVTGPPGPHNPKNDEYVRELFALRESLEVEEEVIFLMERWQDEVGRPRTLSDETIADLYRVADALFFPSTQEGFGIPILEAGLVRLPIFCSRLEPFLEIAGQTPYYFEPTDPPATIARLLRQRLNDNPQFRLRRTVIENYTWESIFDKLLRPLVGDEWEPGSRVEG